MLLAMPKVKAKGTGLFLSLSMHMLLKYISMYDPILNRLCHILPVCAAVGEKERNPNKITDLFKRK